MFAYSVNYIDSLTQPCWCLIIVEDSQLHTFQLDRFSWLQQDYYYSFFLNYINFVNLLDNQLSLSPLYYRYMLIQYVDYY